MLKRSTKTATLGNLVAAKTAEPAREGVKPVKYVRKEHKEHKVETKTEAALADTAAK